MKRVPLLLPRNGPAELPPSLRRLRHLHGIIGRKLRIGNEDIPLNTFFTLHEDTQLERLEKPFYISEVVFSSNNPQWCSFTPENFRFLPESSPSLTNIIVIVWECSSFPLRIVFKMRVNLADLALLGTLDIDLPENTIVFELNDGFYVTSEVRAFLEEQGVIVTQEVTQEDEKKSSCTRAKLMEIVKLKRDLYAAEAQMADLVSRIESLFSARPELFDKLRQRNEHSSRVARMRLEYQQLLESNQKYKESIQARSNALEPRALKLKEAQIALLASSSTLAEQQASLQTQRAKLEETTKLIRLHICRLVAELRQVYRIEVLDGSKMAINGIVLPNSQYTGCDEEQIATALGYVCHLVHLLSQYLDVPLRYPMQPMMSRSSIQDPISNIGRYPLFSKGQEASRFEYGVYLLNKNIEQLSHSQNIDIESLRATLPNLKALMDSFLPPEKLTAPTAASTANNTSGGE